MKATIMELKVSPLRLLRHAIKQLEILIAMDEVIPTTFQSFRRDVAIGEIIGGLEQYLAEIQGDV